MTPFSRVLVANRGEIAVRIFRTLRELGIGTVAVYSEADRGALHARVADEAFLIGPPPAAESYLVVERLIETAKRARRRGGPSRLRLPRRERRVRPRRRGGRARLDRAATGGDRADGEQDGCADGDEGRRRADRARDDGPGPTADEVDRDRRRDRLADRDQGVSRRRRERAQGRALGRGRSWSVRVRSARGRGVLRRPSRVRRAVPRRSSARRGAGARRRATDMSSTSASASARSSDATRSSSRRRRRLRSTTHLRARIGTIAVDAAKAAGYRSAGTIEGLALHATASTSSSR